jgi:CO/xanthine dehydrogenase Mo-binding subunit
MRSWFAPLTRTRRLPAIDVMAARGMPGVAAVYTADDLTDVNPSPGGIGFPRPDGGPSAKTDRPLLVRRPRSFRG